MRHCFNVNILQMLFNFNSLLIQPLKGLFTQKLKFCYEFLALMSFQTHKTFVHLRNTNEDVYIIFYEIQELFDPV